MSTVAIVCLAGLAVSAVAAQACTGDCGDDGQVSVNELVVAVNAALGGAPVEACAAADADGDGAVSVAELVTAVNNALHGCGVAATATASPSASATPTVTPSPALGPVITFIGLTSADDSLQPPTDETPEGVPIFERPFGFGFSVVVEARHSSVSCSGAFEGAPCPAGERAFSSGGAPDLQVQVTRPLGDGSAAVCDNGGGEPPAFGGVPAIDPPQVGDPDAVADVLNDLGCRFVDGTGAPTARNCGTTACIRFEDGEFGCAADGSIRQFCAPIPMPMAFPVGETLLSARLRDVAGRLGPVARMIVRIAPP